MSLSGPSKSASPGTEKQQKLFQQTDLALVHGPTEPPLWNKTLGTLLDEQANKHGDKIALIFPWQSARISYQQLADRSKIPAKAMLAMGLRHGDCVGIMAGNCYQYIEVFLGGGRIGCPVVVFNSTYTPEELTKAAAHTSCKLIFVASQIGQRQLGKHWGQLLGNSASNPALPELRLVVSLGDAHLSIGVEQQSYSFFLSNANSVFMSEATLKRAERKVKPSDVLNIQFTSGTMGSPKAAMLTHVWGFLSDNLCTTLTLARNLLNNGRFTGDAMRLTLKDTICCGPPLFHCFGLVMGFLNSLCHGSSIIYPSDTFDAQRTLDAVVQEKATALMGVPTMFLAMLEAMKRKDCKINTIRASIAGGSAVPKVLMKRLRKEMGIDGLLVAYGMTETSPVTFISSLDDPDEKRTGTLGRVAPHTSAKVMDREGKIVRRGGRGELCTSGYALQKGYWKNEEKTREVMRADDQGTLWMHTGDEVFIDEEGYGHITGRIKDIIIRGGENIWPIEIEERLMSHVNISEAAVAGLKDTKYGEVVACFLKEAAHSKRIDDDAVRAWVTETLGDHKAPKYVFWIGNPGVGSDFPKTGSGKYQKHVLREIGDALVKKMSLKASL